MHISRRVLKRSNPHPHTKCYLKRHLVDISLLDLIITTTYGCQRCQAVELLLSSLMLLMSMLMSKLT